MSFESREAGEYGGTWIPAASATTAAKAKNFWCKFTVVNDMTVTAVVGSNIEGTHGTQVWKAGTEIRGHFTSITTTAASAAGLIWAAYGSRHATT